jgi:tight adherence protein B
MERIVSTLRAQAAYEARYRALTAEGRTSGLILGSLPLLILAAVLIVQPGYLASLFKSGPGRVVFSIAFALWMLGIAWLMRLVRPAV